MVNDSEQCSGIQGKENSPYKYQDTLKTKEPFFQHALDYWKAGLSLVPCKNGKNRKRAIVKWKQFQLYQPYEYVVLNWAEKHPDANIGLITGKVSNIIVIDCDDPNRSQESLEEEYGETPVIVQTPRGGLHLYYRYNSEKSGQYAEAKIDIRGDGGLIIAPPSINPELGKSYQFIKGNLDDLSDLPIAKNVDLQSGNTSQVDIIPNGKRNTSLFYMLKEAALHIESYDRLYERALEINHNSLETSLSQAEITKTVNSVWGYKLEGSLWPKCVMQFAINKYDFYDLSDVPYASMLYDFLVTYHYGVRESFCIAQAAVAKNLGWRDRRNVKNAIDTLLERGKLKVVHRARGQKPHQYAFGPSARIAGR